MLSEIENAMKVLTAKIKDDVRAPEQEAVIWMSMDIELPPADWSGLIMYGGQQRTAGYNGKHFTGYVGLNDDPLEAPTHWLKNADPPAAREPVQQSVEEMERILVETDAWGIGPDEAAVKLFDSGYRLTKAREPEQK